MRQYAKIMQTKLKFNRRSFIKTSAVAGGGVLFSFNFFTQCTNAETVAEIEAIPSEWFDVNAFLKIADTGHVTIMAPNPEIGQGVKTSMPMIVAEELDVDWEKVIVEQAPYNKVAYTRQVAGGSQSIRQGWESLRITGATARKMLVDAAAKKWEVEAAECTTKGGVIYHEKTKQSIGYEGIVNNIAGMEVPEKVDLKDPKDFTIIGQDIKNVDNLKIVKGEPVFGMDMKKEGMKIAMAIHPPAFGMKIKSVDAAAAKAMSGIEDIVEFDDIVGIVGNSTWEVMKAKKAVKVEWKTDGVLENSEDHDNALAAALEKPTKEPARKDGNPEAAFKNAAKIVEQTYEAPYLAHNTLSPMNYFAHVTEEGVKTEGPIQTPEWTARRIAEKLEVPEEKVSIMMTRMGGGFGRRLYGDFALEACMISKLTKKPIKLIYSREDDMTKGMYRPAYKLKYRAALDADNNLLAMHVRGAGMTGRSVIKDSFPAGSLENYLVEGHELDSKITTAAWRAPVSNFIGYTESAFIDELAEAMGKDVVDLRIELLDKAINNPVGELSGDPKRYKDVIELAKEKSNWGEQKEGVHKGFAAFYSHNTYVAEVAEVEMKNGQPTVTKVICAIDCGLVVNPLGAMNQIQGGVVDGIGHAMYSALSFKDGAPEQENFNNYRLIRMNEAPKVEAYFVNTDQSPTGLGEPTLPPAGGAVANAIYKAVGQRLTKQPFVKEKALMG